MKYANDQQKKIINEQLAEVRRSLPQGKSMPSQVKTAIKELESQVKTLDTERVEMERTIETLKNTLPYNRFMMIGRYLIPLVEKNLRDDPRIIAFKYGGEMSVLGYVTNTIDSLEQREHGNDFAPLYDTMNKVMLSLFKNTDTVFILHPIAIYY